MAVISSLTANSGSYFFNYKHAYFLGAIDGKQAVCHIPAHSGSCSFKYKHNFFTLLMVIADTDCIFWYVNVGTNSTFSGGGVYVATDMCSFEEKNKFSILSASHLSKNIPFFHIS